LRIKNVPKIDLLNQTV